MFSFEVAFSRSFWWNSVRNCRVKGWTLKTQRKIEPVTSSRVQRGRLCGVDFWLGNKATVSKKSRQINTVFPWKFELRLVWSWIQSRNFQENSSICLEKSAAKSKKQKKVFFSWNCSGAESVATLAAFSLAETAAVLSAKKNSSIRRCLSDRKWKNLMKA